MAASYHSCQRSACHEDGTSRVVPAKAGTHRRMILFDVRPWDSRWAWIPAWAGMTRSTQEKDPVEPLESEFYRYQVSPAGGQGFTGSRTWDSWVKAPFIPAGCSQMLLNPWLT